MKKFYFVFMLLACAGCFVACSDNDGDGDGNGQGAGNGGTGVTVLEKKITQIKRTGEDPTTLQFDYDAEGRLNKMTRLNSTGEEEETISLTYTKDQVTYTLDGLTSTITLKDGKAQCEVFREDSRYTMVSYFTYFEDYISFITEKDYYDQNEQNSLYTTRYTVKDGKLESSMFVNEYRGVRDTTIIDYSYEGSAKNNTNVDLWSMISDEDFGNHASFLCVAGKRFTYLPAQAIEKATDGEIYETVDFKYVVDADGYITKITVTETEEDEEVEVNPMAKSVSTYVHVYEIMYK